MRYLSARGKELNISDTFRKLKDVHLELITVAAIAVAENEDERTVLHQLKGLMLALGDVIESTRDIKQDIIHACRNRDDDRGEV